MEKKNLLYKKWLPCIPFHLVWLLVLITVMAYRHILEMKHHNQITRISCL